jgi:diketogulonate reductase-like aldo/keto reductase
MLKRIQSKSGDYDLTPMGIGAMGFGGYFTKNLKNNSQQVRLIEEACDLGVNVIDTAEIYGQGASEETIGKTSQSVRNNLFIMSKFSPENSRPDDIVSSVNASLKRIKRDYLDVYQPHWPLPGAILEDTLESLEKLKLSGKIRFSGLSNFNSQQINSVSLEKYKSLRFIQCERNPIEHNLADDLIPIIDSLDGVLVSYSPFREGQIFKSTKFDELTRFSKSLGFTPSQVLLAWGMANGKTIVIPKVSSSKHLRENIESMKISLYDSDIDYISDLFKPQIKQILPKDIIPDISVKKDKRAIYKNLEEAKNNIYNFHPGPMDIVKEIQENQGLLYKPIKVKEINKEGKYVLIDGRLRFWAWIILNGWNKPMDSIIINSTKI